MPPETTLEPFLPGSTPALIIVLDRDLGNLGLFGEFGEDVNVVLTVRVVVVVVVFVKETGCVVLLVEIDLNIFQSLVSLLGEL